MRKIDKNMSEGEIDNLIRAADKDKDGRINYEEFAEALANDLP